MAISQKEEARALSADERELVEKSHHPTVQELSDAALADLMKLMRDRRAKAKTQADQRRREIRGKSAPRGASPSRSDEGSQLKVAVLAMAMRRLNSEAERRRRMAARVALMESAKEALAMKQAAETDAPFNSRRAHQGMRNESSQRAKSLVRPMELGRQRKAASVAQARRDGR
ncbi:MAG: hypothetical protein CTY15_00030 [Methylocystis sp.]|nr:MAG: hypothetical protein CTY15_00030 [Methylocystis sp.]